MKLGLVFAALSMVACAKTVTAPAPKAPVAAATPEDCNKVYDNLLVIAIQSTGENYTPEQMPAAKTVLDLLWRAEGKSELFFNSCLATANQEQTTCMAKADSFESVKSCAQLFETKKRQ